MNKTNYHGQSGKKMFGREGGCGVCYLRVLCVVVWVLLHVSWNPLHSETFAILPRNDRFFGHTVLLASKLRLHSII